MSEWVSMQVRLLVPALALAVALITSPLSAQQGSPEEVVGSYYDVLTEMWRNADELGFQGRYDKVAPAVTETFDMRSVAAASVGRQRWETLDEGQREKLIAAFTRLSAATYAARFDKYSGQKFEILGRQDTDGERVMVKTQVVPADGKPTAINYLMHVKDGRWQVIDVHLRGRISEVATRRGEFGSVIRHEGIDGLLAAIDKKIEQLRGA